jgi:O-acetyl-ADP-ribose deacetylase (regulator of RNase III)
MSININKDLIFDTGSMALVNPVNCVGVMGAGLALLFRQRYPTMFKEYRDMYRFGLLEPGHVYYHPVPGGYVIINFTTKDHWKKNSEYEWIYNGLLEFKETYSSHGITSVTFPLLGAGRGGLEKKKVLDMMVDVLSDIDIEINITLR